LKSDAQYFHQQVKRDTAINQQVIAKHALKQSERGEKGGGLVYLQMSSLAQCRL
jgi:hypothetical protein